MRSLGNLEELNQGTKRTGRGIDSIRAHIERAGDHARSLGATVVPMRKIADDYLREVEGQHIGEGFEVLDDKPEKDKPLVALHEQAAMQACLKELQSTPLLRKRTTPVHVINGNASIDQIELLYRASEIALGLRHRKPVPANGKTLQAEVIVEPKRKKFLGIL